METVTRETQAALETEDTEQAAGDELAILEAIQLLEKDMETSALFQSRFSHYFLTIYCSCHSITGE